MSAHHDRLPPMNHVFVDYENVHEIDPAVIGSKSVSFTILLGAKQTKLDTVLVEKMMAHASSVHLVRLASIGKNALDFTLAFYLGQAATIDPAGYFHIITKDKGFDPMIEHLRTKHIHVRRHDSFATLTFSSPDKAPSQSEDLFPRVLEDLRKNKSNRPKRKKTLLSRVTGFAGNGAPEQDILRVINKLQTEKHIKIDEKEAVNYLL